MYLVILFLHLLIGQDYNLNSFAVKNSSPSRVKTVTKYTKKKEASDSTVYKLNREKSYLLKKIASLNDTIISLKNWDTDTVLGKVKFIEAVDESYFIMFTWILITMVLLLYWFFRYHFYAGFAKKKYIQIIDSIDKEESVPEHEKHHLYPVNPYKDETFGLPKGTVRGILSLTILVFTLLIAYISIFAYGDFLKEKNLEFLTDAFLMMIAFYFGSKAVDVYQASQKTKRKEIDKDIAEISSTESDTVRIINPDISSEENNENLVPSTSPVQDIEHKDSKDVAKMEQEQDRRILSLTAYFETARPIEEACQITAGNFDGMGVSFGCLQWNFGMGSLQPLLKRFFNETSYNWRGNGNMKELYQVLSKTKKEQLAWADTIQSKVNKKFILDKEWKECFAEIGKNSIDIQVEMVQDRIKIAKGWCHDFGLQSERALSLMFDICVQNGNLYKVSKRKGIDAKASIDQRIRNAGNPNEEEKLVIIAEERSKASNPRWVPIVMSRKLCIAKGSGKVYGKMVELKDFDIRLDRQFV